MRRPVLLLASTLVLLPVHGTAVGEGTASVRTFMEADQVGSSGDDTSLDTVATGHLVWTVGAVDGQLPEQSAAGGRDAFVRLLGDNPGAWQDELQAYDTVQFGSSADDSATAVANEGNRTVIAGWTEGDLFGESAGGKDAWLGVYDLVRPYWTVQLGGPGDDEILDVTLTDDGVYAVGTSDGQATVWKYDFDGGVAWSADLGTPEGSGATSRAAAVVGWGDGVVAVQQLPEATDGPASRLVALDGASGAQSWASEVAAGTYVTAVRAGAFLLLAGDDGDAFLESRNAADGSLGARSYLLDGLDLTSATSRVTGAAWDGTSVVVAVSDSRHGSEALLAVSPAGDRHWLRRLPAGFAATSVSVAGLGALVGGTTTGTLVGTPAGGTDAALLRYVTYQPDARVRIARRSAGDDVYVDGSRGQTLRLRVTRGQTLKGTLVAENDGETRQVLRLRSCARHDGYRFTYGSAQRTRAITHGGLDSNPLGADFLTFSVPVRITATASAAPRTSCVFAVSSAVTKERDRLRISIRLRGHRSAR